MKIISGLRKRPYFTRASVFLTIAALIVGMVGYGGCNGSDPYANYIKIYDWYDLDDVRDNLDGNYTLMNDLDSTTTGYTELASPAANGGKGWQPIGAGDDPFTGTFDGQEYQIEDLFINRPTETDVGLFAYVDEEGVIENVGMVNVDMTGEERVGGLVGLNLYGTVINSYSTGSVSGNDSGGLVGFNFFGTVINSYSTGSVTGYTHIGGLVGENCWGSTVSDSYSTASATGEEYVGGLVGYNEDSTVSDSYSTGSVTGGKHIGGLVGENCWGSTVSDSYSNGNVTGYTHIGGLVGENSWGSTVSNSYSTGCLTGEEYVGGLVGTNVGGFVNNSYSSGNVTGEERVGGLVGYHRGLLENFRGTVSNSYYNYDEVSINGENIITIGALFSGDFEQWLANDKFLDVNERLSQENGYYVINDITDFKELLAFGQDNSLKFRLKNDIDLATEPDFYIPYLAGKFYGDGYTISNLSLSFGFVYAVGLFAYLASSGEVHKLDVENINITGWREVGGLVGRNEGVVSNSYSTGCLTGEDGVGGLVGYNVGTVSNSYSAGNVTGEGSVGGLVGDNREGTVNNSYSTGNVNGIRSVGGLVGHNQWGTVTDSYSVGTVTGNSSVGGLVGSDYYGTVSESFWDTETSGQATSDGGTGKTTTEMQEITTFSGATWDIVAVANPSIRNPSYTWNIVDDETYPFLSWEP